MTSKPIDQLTAAIGNLSAVAAANDAATTVHAAEIAALKERVKNDDITNEELVAALDSLAASAASISSDSADLAGLTTEVSGIEPAPAPPVEPPVEPTP